MEEYENGKDFDEKHIGLFFHIAVFYYKGHAFYKKRMTKPFKKYMIKKGYNRLLEWAEKKEEELNE